MQKWILAIVAVVVLAGIAWYFTRPELPQHTVDVILTETARPQTFTRVPGVKLTVKGKDVLTETLQLTGNTKLNFALNLPPVEADWHYTSLFIVPRRLDAPDADYEVMDLTVDQMLGLSTSGTGDYGVQQFSVALAPGSYKTRYFLQLRSNKYDVLPRTILIYEGIVEVAAATDGTPCTARPLAAGNSIIDWQQVAN